MANVIKIFHSLRHKIKKKKHQLKHKIGRINWRGRLLDYAFYMWLGVGVLDYLNSALIYSFYFIRDTAFPLFAPIKNVVIEVLREVLFPFTMAAAILYAVFVWCYLLLDKNGGEPKLEHKIRAAYNTTMAILAVAGTVAGLVLLGPTAAIYTIVIYGASLTLSAVFNFGGTAYHIMRAKEVDKSVTKLKEKMPNLNPELLKEIEKAKEKRSNKAVSHLVVGVTSILIAIAGFCVGTLGLPYLAILGIAAGLAGAAFFALSLGKIWLDLRAADKKGKAEKPQSPTDEAAQTQTTLQIKQQLPEVQELMKQAEVPARDKKHYLVPSFGLMVFDKEVRERRPAYKDFDRKAIKKGFEKDSKALDKKLSVKPSGLAGSRMQSRVG